MKNLAQLSSLGYRQAASTMLLAVTLIIPSLAASQTGQQPTRLRKPVIAFMDFENNSMTRRDEFSALSGGIPAFLAIAMATNPNIQIIERKRLQEVIGEQDLSASGRVDPEKIIKAGKLLGVNYILFGTFFVQTDMKMRLGVRAVDSETGAISYVETANGKGEQILEIIDKIAARVNAGLKLPGVRDVKAVKDQGLDGPNQMDVIMAVGAAHRLLAQGDLKGASAQFDKALKLNPQMASVRTQLASIERTVPK